MKFICLLATVATLMGCSQISDERSKSEPHDVWVDLSKRDKPASIVDTPWTEIVVGVPDFEGAPKLFTNIGGFTQRFSDENSLVLGAPGVEGGLIRFERTASDAVKTRPFGSRSWDTGCYFSIMMRAKNIPSIIEDAKVLGWTPLTDMAYLEFGPSKLNIVVLGHKATGIQVQLYERLTTPLPEGFPNFDRLSPPFNMMQMVRDRDAGFDFYQQTLGFETFYYGKPSVSQEPEVMPLGIPVELTTSVAYQAGIMTPKQGLEWGRMEMIEVMMDGGKDLSDRCHRGNIGITTVRFKVDDVATIADRLAPEGMRTVIYTKPDGSGRHTKIKTPDGANIEFYEDEIKRDL